MAGTSRNERSGDDARPPGETAESGPLGGGEPIEPTPAAKDRHPTAKAERRSAEIRGDGGTTDREDG